MGIFDKIKFKKNKDGKTVEKTEKAVVSDSAKKEEKEKEVAKAVDVVKKTESKVKGKKVEKVKLRKKVVSGVRNVVINPLITEKSARLASEDKYIFAVDPRSNQIEIKSAISNMYGIIPVKVNVLNVKGKKVRFGRRKGKRKDWKKAIVTLPKGKKIDVYEGV